MSLTLKQILDISIGACGVTVPATWIGSNNVSSSNQLLAIANQSVMGLRERGFQKQIRSHSFTLTSESSAYALPSDFFAIVPDTMWMGDSLWLVDFPTDPTVWAYLTAGAGFTGNPQQARFINGFLEFFEPQDGLAIGFEYLSNAPITDGSTGAPKQLFTQDADVWLLDDGLITTDIKWRYKAEKGLDFMADLELFKRQLINVMGRDGGAQTILSCIPEDDPPPYCNLWVSDT